MAKLSLTDLASLTNESTAISAINNNNTATETAMEKTLSRDGTSPNEMNANLDMNSNRILNLPNPASELEPLRLRDLADFLGIGTVTTTPSGGAAGAVLTKDTSSDYDFSWTYPTSWISSGTARAGLGLGGFAATTFTVAPDGTNVRVAIADAVMQMHYDNIVLGTQSAGVVTQNPRITWKVPDYNNNNGGLDHPLGNVGANDQGFHISAGANGPSDGSSTLPLVLYSQNTAGTETMRVFIAGGTDFPLIGIGTTNPLNDVQASSLQLHASDAIASHIHFTNGPSGANATDGLYVGMDFNGATRIWSYEAQPVYVAINNVITAQFSNSSGNLRVLGFVGAGSVSADPSQLFHGKASAAGSVAATLQLDASNTSSGETHTAKFTAQDNGAGTIRSLFQVPGTLNAGTPNQARFDMTVEDGTIFMMRVQSTSATGGSSLNLFDRVGSGAAQVTLSTFGVSTLAGGGLTVSGGSIFSTHATAGLGYSTGAGGTVTQATSKSTAVTLNKATGQITMNNAALAAATVVSFTLNNTSIAATDLISVMHESGGTLGSYTVNGRATGAGTASIDIRNNTAGSLSEALVLRYAVLKSVNA